MNEPAAGELRAAALIHHQLFTGLLLAVIAERGQATAAAVIYRTFRRQHEEKFLAGLRTLGLSGLPDPLACAQFIYFANLAGGVQVQYMQGTGGKAWVRYPPSRWAYPGPAICAVGNAVSEAFMRGFHARCGMSLDNPRLGFVCTGMTTNGDPGLEGYFIEEPRALAPHERLRFDLGRRGPRFDPHAAPRLPWNSERVPAARRNYAVQYIRVMVPVLIEVLGANDAVPLGRRAAHLVGLQAFDETARLVGPLDPDAAGFLRYLEAMNRGTGHRVLDVDEGGGRLWVEDIRVDGDADSLEIWNGLWTGAAAVHDPALRVTSEPGGEWRVTRG